MLQRMQVLLIFTIGLLLSDTEIPLFTIKSDEIFYLYKIRQSHTLTDTNYEALPPQPHTGMKARNLKISKYICQTFALK